MALVRPPAVLRASGLRRPVLRVAAEVDRREGLVTDDPRVVSRLDRGDIAGPDLGLGAVVVGDLHPTRHAVEQVGRLALLRPGDRLDVLGPAPPRLERAVENRVAADVDHPGLALVGERTRLVGRAHALDLYSRHFGSSRRWRIILSC